MKFVALADHAPIREIDLDSFQFTLFQAWKVQLTHNDQDETADDLSDEKAHRYHRLTMIKVAIIKYGPTTAFKIKELDDHKGTLTVHWHSEPTAAEQAMLSWVWNAFGEESHDSVRHQPLPRSNCDFGSFHIWASWSSPRGYDTTKAL